MRPKKLKFKKLFSRQKTATPSFCVLNFNLFLMPPFLLYFLGPEDPRQGFKVVFLHITHHIYIHTFNRTLSDENFHSSEAYKNRWVMDRIIRF